MRNLAFSNCLQPDKPFYLLTFTKWLSLNFSYIFFHLFAQYNNVITLLIIIIFILLLLICPIVVSFSAKLSDEEAQSKIFLYNLIKILEISFVYLDGVVVMKGLINKSFDLGELLFGKKPPFDPIKVIKVNRIEIFYQQQITKLSPVSAIFTAVLQTVGHLLPKRKIFVTTGSSMEKTNFIINGIIHTSIIAIIVETFKELLKNYGKQHRSNSTDS